MGPRPKPSAPPSSPPRVVIDPNDPRWADVVESFAEAERGEGITLTADEAAAFVETGEPAERTGSSPSSTD